MKMGLNLLPRGLKRGNKLCKLGLKYVNNVMG